MRRALMTGFNQVVAKITEDNAEQLGTDHFEVTYHRGARPTHQPWQGRVYTKEQLVTVCGYGAVDGLKGANCYHDFHPFFPGISKRLYTDEQLDKWNAEENTPKEWGGKQYTVYEALQRQRRIESTLRKKREEIALFETGGANEDDILATKAKYHALSGEYAELSKAMGLPQQRERVSIDSRNGVDVSFGKSEETEKKTVANSGESGILKIVADTESNKSNYLYNKLSREERKEIIAKGRSTDKPIFSYDTKSNKAMSYLRKVPPKEGMYDICAHGSPNSIEFFKQDYPPGDRRASIDAYTLSCIIKGREDYQAFLIECKMKGLMPNIRLFSCSTGREINGDKCFAELLAKELGVTVHAPTKKLYVYSSGNYYVGRKRDGIIKAFHP